MNNTDNITPTCTTIRHTYVSCSSIFSQFQCSAVFNSEFHDRSLCTNKHVHTQTQTWWNQPTGGQLHSLQVDTYLFRTKDGRIVVDSSQRPKGSIVICELHKPISQRASQTFRSKSLLGPHHFDLSKRRQRKNINITISLLTCLNMVLWPVCFVNNFFSSTSFTDTGRFLTDSLNQGREVIEEVVSIACSLPGARNKKVWIL